MDLTPRKRVQIVDLSKHAKKSVREIRKELAIPKSTVGRVVKRSSVSDDVTIRRQRGCGRKRKTTARDEQMKKRNSVEDPRKTNVDLKRDLSAAAVNVHSSTIRRRLMERGKIARRPKKQQLLTKVMKKKRLQWAKKHKKWDQQKWIQVIFPGENHSEVQGYRSQYVRRSKENPSKVVILSKCQNTPRKRCFYFSRYGKANACLSKEWWIPSNTKKFWPNICFQLFELLFLKEVAFFNRIWRRATHKKWCKIF